MNKKVIAGILLSVAISGTAMAQSDSEIVATCVNQVRRLAATDYYGVNGYGSFDAYLNDAATHGNVKMFGTSPAIFQFGKCMAEHGDPLTDAK